MYSSIALSVYLSIYLSVIHQFMYLSVNPSIHLPLIALSLHFPFFHLSSSPSIYLSGYLRNRLSAYVYLSMILSIHPSIDLFIDVSIYIAIYLSICPSLDPFIDLWIYVLIFNLAIYTSSCLPSSQFSCKNQIAFFKPPPCWAEKPFFCRRRARRVGLAHHDFFAVWTYDTIITRCQDREYGIHIIRMSCQKYIFFVRRFVDIHVGRKVGRQVGR